MTDDPVTHDDADDEEPSYCSLCGDPITGADQFCAGCGAATGAGHEHPPK